MVLPALASLSDLSIRTPGGVSLDDEARAEAVLDDASAVVRSVAGKTWVTDGDLDDDIPHVVVLVTVAAARRALANPDGIVQESIDGYAQTFSNASSDVYLTRNEKAAVRSAAGKSGIWSQSTTRLDSGDGTIYLDVVGSDQPIPFLPS